MQVRRPIHFASLAGGVISLTTLLFPPFASGVANAQGISLRQQKPDPHGAPRPARGAIHVPLKTSLYFELMVPKNAGTDRVDPSTLAVELQNSRATVTLLSPGEHFASGVTGWIKPRQDLSGMRSTAVYLETSATLEPETQYSVYVHARSRNGLVLSAVEGKWSFTTEVAPHNREIAVDLDLSKAPITWQGRFFSGPCNVVFGTRDSTFRSTYNLMDEARKSHPRAWSLQRDFWMTGTEDKRGLLPQNLPNIVRERETRRIVSIDPVDTGIALRVQDVFGNDQYGIPDDRPLSSDYHAGDTVLIADGSNHVRSDVISIDDEHRTLIVKRFDPPAAPWKIAYTAPLPTRDDPELPGRFASGGCYLRKFSPSGTPAYYWGRLDKEWDKVHKRYGRRLFVNFADAPIDLALDGRNWTTVKDYVEWHGVVKTITGHLIERYGDDALDFVWSIFNEPDLGPLFWRTDWNELQKYYDYTSDAILRSFEDHGLDSSRVFIGGLELGGIFGTNLRLHAFLAHCSPTAVHPDALQKNAAVADARLNGKRSRRVESLCGDHGGKGAPCDFISIHSYNRSELMAAKLTRAKEIALEIDPEYYRELWINSHESCPDWSPPPDMAAADSYLGNGYFSTWAVDVVRRQLERGATDPRFRFGETLLTIWPPLTNLVGLNGFTRVIAVDADNDGRADESVTIPTPIFHVLNLLSDMGPDYWILPTSSVEGHLVSGFASRDKSTTRVLLYSHNAEDTQSRSDATFTVTLNLQGIHGSKVHIRSYSFDKLHHTYFELGKALRDHPPEPKAAPVSPDMMSQWLQDLEHGDENHQLQAIEALGRHRRAVESAAGVLLRLAGDNQRPRVQEAAMALARSLLAPRGYPRAAVDELVRQSRLEEPKARSQSVENGRVRLKADLVGNGVTLLILDSEDDKP